MAYREIYRFLREMSEKGDDKEKQRRKRGGNVEASVSERLGDTAELAEVKSLLQQMDSYDFEYFVADLWARMGWETAVSSESADKGIDVTAVRSTPYRTKALIQAKRYGPNTTVGSPDVQQYASLKQQRQGVDKVVIVTTNEFTGQARELAGSLNVKLVNGDELAAMVDQLDAHDLVRDYLGLPEPERDEETVGDEEEEVGAAKKDETAATEESEAYFEASVPPKVWKWGVAAGTVGWIALFALVERLSDTSIALLFLFSWLVLPLSVYMDTKLLREQKDDSFRYRWAYIAGSAVWFLSILVGVAYLWRRRSVDAETAEALDGEEGEERRESDGEEDGSQADEKFVYDGTEYVCTEEGAADGWTVYRGRSEGDETALVVRDDETVLSQDVESVVAADVSSEGVTAVADGLDDGVPSGRFVVVDAGNERLVTHLFNSDIADCAVTDGYAAVSTLSPDDTTYVFDTESGEVAEQPNIRGEKKSIRFDEAGGETVVGLSEERDDEPLYYLDMDGEVVRKSDRLRRRERLDELLEGGRDGLEEAVEELRERHEEREDVETALELADACLALADEVKEGEGVTDECWDYLEEAKESYYEAIPRYDGRQGVAEVLRRQAEYYVRRNADEAALSRLREIEELEENDGELLTEEDRRRIERLS